MASSAIRPHLHAQSGIEYRLRLGESREGGNEAEEGTAAEKKMETRPDP